MEDIGPPNQEVGAETRPLRVEGLPGGRRTTD